MFTVAAFYKFTRFPTPSDHKVPLEQIAQKHSVKGTILLAKEGINGTIAGTREDLEPVLERIRVLPGCQDLVWKESVATEMPFNRMKIRLKREIVTLGRPDVDPQAAVGTYVQPKDWNDLIEGEDVVVIDTRNDYEFEIGTFERALDPKTKAFGEFPAWWNANSGRFQGKKIAMFCTGGIRCEKATNFLIGEGVDEVYHLRGGILKYLEEVPEEESLWHGECFVFDGRVSVGHGLAEGSYNLCHGCRRPVSAVGKLHSAYERGVSCPACYDKVSIEDKARFRERQKQIDLAGLKGKTHIGSG